MFRNARPSSGADADRALADLVQEGVVESVDLDAGKAVVRIGEILTPPIDWTMWAGDTTIWMAPCEGQPVIVTAPEGDSERAYISGGLSSSAMAPLFLGAKVGIRFKDGALITYDPDSRKLDFSLPGEALITASNGARLVADVAIEGDLDITGAVKVGQGLTAEGVVTGKQDVVFAGVSAKAHRHLAGNPLTGVAQ